MIAAIWLYLTLLAFTVQDGINFDTDILPVLTKVGCNAGACHGAAAGRGEFHLSLFGADATADYEAMVHALEGRRVNLAHPEKSLILLKPTGQLDHGGELVLEEDDPKTARLRAWLIAGAPRGRPRQLSSLEVTPRRQLCENVPATIPLKVIAHYEDGSSEDVTRLTVFTSSDSSAVQIDEDHQAHLMRRGQHTVIARFLNQVVPLQFHAPYSDSPIDLSAEPRAGFIDEQVLSLLADLRLPVSPPASDAAWLRRVSLDLLGRLPEPAQVEAFVADLSPDKRSRLVDSMLASDNFAEYWTLHFARLLHLHSLPNETQGMQAYADWLHQELTRGSGLDEMARQLLTATGDSHQVGPANFGRMVPDARAQAELVGEVFLGMKFGCANCHNHPLDKWTQDDYHGLAAVFARLERGRQVQLNSRGAVTNLRTREPAIPRIPGERDLLADQDHRAAVWEWVTTPEQPHFARATVNRLWRAMFGRGLVEPADDLRETNPATHPELLEILTRDFVDNGYNLRHTLKRIALSHTYARSCEPVPGNEMDDRFYARAYRRSLAPEVLVDAISDVTGVAEKFDGRGATRAISVLDPLAPAPALDVLGRCNRTDNCNSISGQSPGVPAQLHLINGELINQKLTHKDGRLQQLIESGRSDAEIVAEFFVRGFGRPPSTAELQGWSSQLAAGDPDHRHQRLEDFVWALLNSRDFLENH